MALILGLLFGTVSAGCRFLQTAADVPGQAVRAVTPGTKDKNAVDLVELQQNLLRFADEFSTRMILSAEQLRRGTNDVDIAEVLQWKIAFGTKSCHIASRPNTFAGLLDMTVFVTTARMALEEYWQPKVFGESARPMLESCRNSETEIWRLAGVVLKSPQLDELRQAIEVWRRQNPIPEHVLAARATGFASQLAQTVKADATKPGSVFSLLLLDPFSGLDPATREIAEARLFAERALYVAQMMPMLLRWHAELLNVNATRQPTVQQFLTNSSQIAASVERFAHVAEQLPSQISAEREQILEALQAQEKNLTPLVNEVRQTLVAGSQMSTSLNTTITTFDGLMKRFGVGEPNTTDPPSPDAEPFRVQDYGQTAAQLEAAARQLTDLLITLDRTVGSTNLSQLSAQVGPVVEQAQSGGKEIVDYAFWKGVSLAALVLVFALIYRLLATRISASCSSSSPP